MSNKPRTCVCDYENTKLTTFSVKTRTFYNLHFSNENIVIFIMNKITRIVSFCLLFSVVNSSLSDYINAIGSYVGFKQETKDDSANELYNRKIPYEVSIVDEQFLSEAAKLTGVVLSELDSCQHRVVLKLSADCEKLNDEQLAKMSVHLLNCQSFVEGRQIFPCTEEMSIKQCTTNMDADTWTSYHLMSNRVRAVCYTIRQTQFRGLAEHTVNRLMDTARDQLKTLSKISVSQDKLKNLAETTYDSLIKGQDTLSKQQEDMQKAQFHGQLVMEDNIQRLIDEKRLIQDAHNELTTMTKLVQDKLDYSLQQLDEQTDENRINHKQLLNDLIEIQRKTKEIFKKIEESSSLLIQQNEDFKRQYQSSLASLQEVNRTVHNLVTLVGGTRDVIEERLAWITTALGGTDMAVERIYLTLWHVGFMLIAMLTCAFLSARASTRLVVAILPPLNLAAAMYDREHQYLDFISLTLAVGVFVIVQILILSALNWKTTARAAIPWIKEQLTPSKKLATSETPLKNGSPKHSVSSSNYRDISLNRTENDATTSRFPLDEENESTDNFKDFDLTPPVSRNGYYPLLNRSRSKSNTPLRLNTGSRGPCHAKTRVGTPCKLTAIPGRDYCYRHQMGDSVMG